MRLLSLSDGWLFVLSCVVFLVLAVGCVTLGFITRIHHYIPGFHPSNLYGPILYPWLVLLGLGAVFFLVDPGMPVEKFKKIGLFLLSPLVVLGILWLLFSRVKSVRLFD